MKKLFIGISFCMIAFFISSCGNQNKSSENQSVTEPSVQNTDSVTTAVTQGVAPAEQNQNPRQRSAVHVGTEISGQQIVENISTKLNEKLNLSEEQYTKLKGILSKKFTDTFGDLNVKYDIENGKKIGHDLRLKSATEISSVLNPEQKEHFEKFMNK